MKKLLILFAVCFSITANAQQPRVFLMDAQELVYLQSAAAKDAALQPLLANLRRQADKFLQMKPVSVMEKSFTPASGNKHDYMSQAPYFWYDSSKPNGLPYLRRDGERNPEILKITDRKNLGDLEKATTTLALTYYLTNDEKYARKAVELLDTWFLNNDTKMNPHLDYGQAVPGVNTGRGIGIIETNALTSIADAVGLLANASSWTKEKDAQLKQWYAAYLEWLLKSKNGKDEMAAKNNHGTFYAMQVIDYALFTGNKLVAKETAEAAKKRMDNQMERDGSMPLELERTTAKGYATFNLEAWFKVAKLASFTGVDLWNYQTTKGASIKKALDWLTPYFVENKPWPYQQIHEYKLDKIYILFKSAAKQFKAPQYTMSAQLLNYTLTDPVEAILYR